MEKKTIFDLHRVDVEEYRSLHKMPLVIVADNIRSLNNIGSLFRTADAFLVSELMLCGITACPPSSEIHKTALGAELSVKWSYWDTTATCVEALRADGYEICVLEQVKRSVALQDFCPERTRRYALVLGHEVEGVDQDIVDRADHCIEIPQAGTKHSLNVSVAAGIAMWHFFRALHL